MTNDERGCARRKGLRGRHDVVDHRLTGDVMQHFRARGFHARALACGQDDDVQVQGGHAALTVYRLPFTACRLGKNGERRAVDSELL